MAELHALHAYYVNNTRRSPFFNVGSVDSFKKYLEKLDSRNLPFLVALPVDAHPEDTPNPKEERILGYIYLAPYGSEGLGIAFASTVELFVYVHPEYTGLGIGTCLMYGMLADLNTMPYWPHTAVEEHLNGETSEITYAEVKNVVVSIPMDPDDEEEGHVLAAWFVSKFGFQLTGTLHKVCFKLGKW